VEAVLVPGVDLEDSLGRWDEYWSLVKLNHTYLCTPKTKKTNPWVTRSAREACKRRSKAAAALAKDPENPELKQKLRAARKEAQLICFTAKAAYVRKIAASEGGIRGKGFALLDVLLGRRGGGLLVPVGTSDGLTKAFLSKVSRLRVGAAPPPLPPLPPRTDSFPEFEFVEVSTEDVVSALRRSAQSSAQGADEISMKVVKLLQDHLTPWVVSVANHCISESRWPVQWKRAVVLPIYKKKGCTSDVANYRPIAILLAISRVVERVLLDQLSHIHERVLPPQQHGFRRAHSTETALLHLLETVVRARDMGHVVLICSADLASAFDTVDHERILYKARSRAGFGPRATELLRSYLLNREQSVQLAGSTGTFFHVPNGVPQGSVLGPTVFATYVADLPEKVPAASTFLFADDTKLVTSAPTLEDAREKMSEAIRQLEDYCADNLLFISPKKSQLLLVGDSTSITLSISGVEVPNTETIKVLGVLLDANLTWEPHARATAASASALARNVRDSLKGLPHGDVASLMAMIVHPVLDYGLNALALPSARAVEHLRRAYNRTARFATGNSRSEPARELLNWPSREDRRQALLKCFVMRVWEDGLPASLRSLLPPADDPASAGLPSRLKQMGFVRSRQALRAVGGKAFSCWAPGVVTSVLSTEPVLSPPPTPSVAAAAEAARSRARSGRAKSPDFDAEVFHASLRHTYEGRRETTLDGRVVVWTDGSGPVGRAGGGVFYGSSNFKNAVVPVDGPLTAQRAELAAAVHVLQTELRDLEIRTDSRYVAEGLNTWRARWRRRAWYDKPTIARFMKHGDLWHRADRLLDRVDRGAVRVVKIIGHAKQRDVDEGRALEIDAWGNAGADCIAGLAARSDYHDVVHTPHIW
jgi:ribonuclease HI